MRSRTEAWSKTKEYGKAREKRDHAKDRTRAETGFKDVGLRERESDV